MNEHLDDTGALLEAGIMQFNQRKIQALEIFTQHSGLRPPDWAVAAGFYPTRASFSYLLRLHRMGDGGAIGAGESSISYLRTAPAGS